MYRLYSQIKVEVISKLRETNNLRPYQTILKRDLLIGIYKMDD